MNERRSACCGSRYTRQDSSHRGHLHSTDGSYPSRAACHCRSSLRKHIGQARDARTSASGSSVRNLAVSASRTTESRMLAVQPACNTPIRTTPRLGEDVERLIERGTGRPGQPDRSVHRDRGSPSHDGGPRPPGHWPVAGLHIRRRHRRRPDVSRRAGRLGSQGVLRRRRERHLGDHAAGAWPDHLSGVPRSPRRGHPPSRLRLRRTPWESRIEDFLQRGFAPVQSGRFAAQNPFVFFDTEGATGTTFETYDFEAEFSWPEPDEWFPTPPAPEPSG